MENYKKNICLFLWPLHEFGLCCWKVTIPCISSHSGKKNGSHFADLCGSGKEERQKQGVGSDTENRRRNKKD